MSVSSTRRSAATRWATSAASRSLSPKRISSSEVASFSFTTGTTPSSSSRDRVWRAWRYCWRWTKSSGASRTWPTCMPARREGVVVDAHQPGLAHGGDRLQRGRIGGARPAAQRRPPRGDGPRAHEDHAVARGRAAAATCGAQPVDGGGVDAAVGAGHRRGADLGHHGAGRAGRRRGASSRACHRRARPARVGRAPAVPREAAARPPAASTPVVARVGEAQLARGARRRRRGPRRAPGRARPRGGAGGPARSPRPRGR